MPGDVDPVAAYVSPRRPLPMPPTAHPPVQTEPLRAPVEAPPPYSRSTLSSAAPPPPKRNIRHWWKSWSFWRLWKSITEQFIQMSRRFANSVICWISKKKKAPIQSAPEQKVVVAASPPKVDTISGFAKGEEFTFRFKEAPHLAYLAKHNDEGDLELLGLHFVVKEGGGEEAFRELDQLTDEEWDDAVRERHLIFQPLEDFGSDEDESERALIAKTPFRRMLNDVIDLAYKRGFDGAITRRLNSWDVIFVADYICAKFREELDSREFKPFFDDVIAFKRRLKKHLFHDDGSAKTIFPLVPLGREKIEDFKRFKEMLGFVPSTRIKVEPSEIKDQDLYKYWALLEAFSFRPHHQIALLLDKGEEVSPELYEKLQLVYVKP